MTTLTLIIGNKNYSSWSLRPWIFMKQMGLPFTEKRIALYTDTYKEALSRYNSGSKVPILLDNTLTIWDSLSILEYISDVYLDGGGWPIDSEKRAVARSVSAEMHANFLDMRTNLPMNCRKTFSNMTFSKETNQDIQRIKDILQFCREKYGENGDWLFGDYSIADAVFTPVILRFQGYGVSLEGVVDDYAKLTLQQPALIEWIKSGVEEKEIIKWAEISDKNEMP